MKNTNKTMIDALMKLHVLEREAFIAWRNEDTNRYLWGVRDGLDACKLRVERALEEDVTNYFQMVVDMHDFHLKAIRDYRTHADDVYYWGYKDGIYQACQVVVAFGRQIARAVAK